MNDLVEHIISTIFSTPRMIIFGQHFAASLATQQYKIKSQPEPHQEHQNQPDVSPGGVNVLLGGVMMGSMILFILWMCYCCRWKDNKFDATACADRPQPFWIDVNSNAYYEALQWSLHQECCEIPEQQYWSPEPMQDIPPRYETVITPPPGYEDVIKENYKKKKTILDVTANNRMHTI